MKLKQFKILYLSTVGTICVDSGNQKTNYIHNPSYFHQTLQSTSNKLFTIQIFRVKAISDVVSWLIVSSVGFVNVLEWWWTQQQVLYVRVEPRERYYCSQQLVGAGDDTTIPSRQVPNGDRFATIARHSLANLCLSAYSCLFAWSGLQ